MSYQRPNQQTLNYHTLYANFNSTYGLDIEPFAFEAGADAAASAPASKASDQPISPTVCENWDTSVHVAQWGNLVPYIPFQDTLSMLGGGDSLAVQAAPVAGCGPESIPRALANFDEELNLSFCQKNDSATVSKPYRCEIAGCNKSFTAERSRQRHMRTVMAHAPKQFRCNEPGCGQDFTRNDLISRHKKTAHGGSGGKGM
ncbi:hypothetical protein PENSPDRAFT_665386 [Peniophora sp. CONT]|nr:hypothetical protein PENSPDRAFT_665386 [Peniophora sp. CONT]